MERQPLSWTQGRHTQQEMEDSRGRWDTGVNTSLRRISTSNLAPGGRVQNDSMSNVGGEEDEDPRAPKRQRVERNENSLLLPKPVSSPSMWSSTVHGNPSFPGGYETQYRSPTSQYFPHTNPISGSNEQEQQIYRYEHQRMASPDAGLPRGRSYPAISMGPPGPGNSSSFAKRRRSDAMEDDEEEEETHENGKKKVVRRTQACDRCRAKKRKCDGAKPLCGNCVKAARKGDADNEEVCTYYAEAKKRGPKKGYRDQLLERVASIEAFVKSGAFASDPVADPSRMLMGLNRLTSSNMNGSIGPQPASELERLARLEAMVSRQTDLNGRGQQLDRSRDLLPQPGAGIRTVGENPRVANPHSWLSNVNVQESLYSFQSIVDEDFDMSWLDSFSATVPNTHTHQDHSAHDNGGQSESEHSVIAESFHSAESDVGSTTQVIALSAPTRSTALRYDAAVPARPLAPPTIHQEASQLDPFESRNPTKFEIHLIDIFFALIHGDCNTMFDEAAFYANLFPVCKHPSFLIDAICCMALLFSTHPEIERLGGRDAACDGYLKRAWDRVRIILSARADMDSLEAVQAMLLLSAVDFGMCRPSKAHWTVNAAIRMAIRLKIDREDWNVSINPLSIWNSGKSNFTASQLEARRRTWEFCMIVDTCAGVVSGFPLSIEESLYPYIISGRRTIRPTLQEDESVVAARAAGFERWRQCLANPPTETIFHGKEPHLPPPIATETNAEIRLAILQICFLLRRVIRLNYSFRQIPLPKPEEMDVGSNVVMGVLPRPDNSCELHDALVDWHAALPERMRVFDSLEDLVAKTDHPGGDGSPQPFDKGFKDAFEFSSPGIVMCSSLYLTALSILHLPRVDDPRPIFRAGGGEVGSRASALRLTRFDVVVLARRAQNHMLRGLMPDLGLQETLGDGGVGSANGAGGVAGGDGACDVGTEARIETTTTTTPSSGFMIQGSMSAQQHEQQQLREPTPSSATLPPLAPPPPTSAPTPLALPPKKKESLLRGAFNKANILGSLYGRGSLGAAAPADTSEDALRILASAIPDGPAGSPNGGSGPHAAVPAAPTPPTLNPNSNSSPETGKGTLLTAIASTATTATTATASTAAAPPHGNHGPTSSLAAKTASTAAYPPPHAVAASPFQAFYVFTLAAAALAVSGFTTERGGKEALEVERGVVTTNLPTADRLSVIWPVAGVYASRLRSVLKAVHAKWEQDRGRK
ncbi:hypothetical protein HDU97_005036 [Phlyctochytrium planicorne]|nr:hypothetical protein HDU97_005036 [Phlyctochytrium planicorne]